MMTSSDPEASYKAAGSDRVVIFAPRGRDGALMAAATSEQGYQVNLCASAQQVIDCIDEGAGALVLTIEGLQAVNLAQLEALLRRQPPWSDLPIVLLVGSGERSDVEIALAEVGNVTALERPVRLPTLAAAIRSAVRARNRQYEMRDLLVRTELQQAHIEALNERLQRAMTETHHRVKNNLQVVAAMIDLQLTDQPESVSAEEFKRLSNHVRMLAVVHDLLTEHSKTDAQVSQVSAKEILERLIPIMKQTAHANIDFHVEDVRLPVRQASSLTLVVNEIVSNAIKHGKGRATIHFWNRDGYALVEVEDDGPGFPPGFVAEDAAHTGLDLVENICRWDLRGTTRYENTGHGGKVSLKFPI